MSLKRDLSGSYWSLLWVAFDFFFCFLILFVHSKPLDMNSFPPRNTKLGQILLWNSSADSWDSENNTNRMSLQPFSKHLWRTSCLCACACMRVSLVQRWALIFLLLWWCSIKTTCYHGLLGEEMAWVSSSGRGSCLEQTGTERWARSSLLGRSRKMTSAWVSNQRMYVT